MYFLHFCQLRVVKIDARTPRSIIKGHYTIYYKRSWSYFLYGKRTVSHTLSLTCETQLTANHICIIVSPVVITYGPPNTCHLDFNSPLATTRTANQTHLKRLWWAWCTHTKITQILKMKFMPAHPVNHSNLPPWNNQHYASTVFFTRRLLSPTRGVRNYASNPALSILMNTLLTLAVKTSEVKFTDFCRLYHQFSLFLSSH